MGVYEGLLGGFLERKSSREAENLAEAQRAAERESAIFNTLLSAEDPRVQELAVAGLLESAKPRRRKGGLRGWLGELESSPYLAQIQAMAGEQVPVTEQVMTRPGAAGLPSKQITPAASTMQTTPSAVPSQGITYTEGGSQVTAAPGAMSTPAQSMTEPGAPPAKPLEYVSTPGPMVGRPPEFEARTTMQRRKIFPTPEEIEMRQERGRARGRIAGRREELLASGIPEEKVQEILTREAVGGRGGGAPRAMFGETIDETGKVRSTTAVFDPAAQTFREVGTGAPLANFRARTTTGSTDLGDYAELAAGELGYESAAAARAAGPDAMRAVTARAAQLRAEVAGESTTARAKAAAVAPLKSEIQLKYMNDLQDKWDKLQAPVREMERNLRIMETSLARFKAGDRTGAPETFRTAFVKLTEPTSVVMPSEFARNAANLPLTARLEGAIERAMRGGGGIPLPQMEEMLETARQFTRGMEGWNAKEQARINALATRYQLDPELITGTPSTLGQQPPGTTAPPAQGGFTPGSRTIDLDTGEFVQ